MVVATDRYIAEDAAERIVVTYEELPVVVGVDAAREATHAVHEDVPDNVAARHHQETGDVEAGAGGRAAHADLHPVHRAQRLHADGGQGRARRAGTPTTRSLRVYTSTQASTSVRAAIAAKLELSLDKVEVIAPDVGGGFGVKIVHPWPEELLVPMAAIALGREVKWTEDRREHFISSAHERQQRQEITVGYDDDGRITALDVHIWHDNGAYTPYGIIVPIVTATQLVGPYVIPVYRVIVESVYTNTVIVTPYRGAGRPQGCYAMERTMDRIADALGPGPGRRPRAEPDPARPVPLRPPPDVPGRPAGHLRLGRLPGADGQAADAGRLVGGRPPPRRGRGARAGCSASAWRCTWRAPGPGRTRAGTCRCSAAARCWSRPG